jgi:hypothetical protein
MQKQKLLQDSWNTVATVAESASPNRHLDTAFVVIDKKSTYIVLLCCMYIRLTIYVCH